jgi:hypothetical protein
MYETFKTEALAQGKYLTVQGITNPYGVECVTLDWAYANFLFPGVSIKQSITTGNANTLFADANPVQFTKVLNNRNDPNQIPPQGAIIVFGATPAEGYSSTFKNVNGHTGIVDSATTKGVYILQQNAPAIGEGVNVEFFNWNYMPCIGWLIPITSAPTPPPSSIKTAKVIADVMVRSAPNENAPLAGSRELYPGQEFEYTEIVTGESVGGVNTWAHSVPGNYVWTKNLQLNV